MRQSLHDDSFASRALASLHFSSTALFLAGAAIAGLGFGPAIGLHETAKIYGIPLSGLAAVAILLTRELSDPQSPGVDLEPSRSS